MNIEKFRKNLKKISKFDNWENDTNVNLTRIEKDILLEYIRKLYKAVLEENDKGQEQSVQKVEKPDLSFPDQAVKKKETKKAKAPQEKIKSEPIIKKDLVEPAIKAPEQPVIQSAKPVVVEPVQKPEQAIEIEAKQTKYADISVEFLAIFDQKASNELSEKLSMLPVDDVKKAFGLNEKIFTINELFDGNNAEFETAVKCLNELKTFSDAKDYIISSLAVKFNWDTELKLKKAEQFVKTIRRRYNN
jgi:hypothetical protein